MVQRASWIAKLAGIALLLLGCETLGVEPTLTPVDPRQPLPTLAVRVEIQIEPTPTVAEPQVTGEDAEPPELPTPPDGDGAATAETPEAPAADATPAAGEMTGGAESPAPAETQAAEDSDSAEPSGNGEELIVQGEQVYQANCATCHQAGGEGTSVFPALADNALILEDDPAAVVDAIIHGRGEMPAFGDALSNEEIAAVASYIRNAWGNQAPPVSEEQVAEVAQTN
ncbi:MAG: hypothetical protein DCC55_28770 [Chloroflexi bacterium]|nr:MAG: hypothetical protein DCC55_28770 [Chloroflexota bacterium]